MMRIQTKKYHPNDKVWQLKKRASTSRNLSDGPVHLNLEAIATATNAAAISITITVFEVKCFIAPDYAPDKYDPNFLNSLQLTHDHGPSYVLSDMRQELLRTRRPHLITILP